jgi:hypothetical protein
VKRLYSEWGVSGGYGSGGEILWDGRDHTGEVVVPGVYICRIKVAGDARNTVINRTIAVTY